MFGPQPRSYTYDLPRKAERGALRSALAQKMRDGALVVVDALAASEVKTKSCSVLLDANSILGANQTMDLTPGVIAALDVKVTQFDFDRERLDGQAAAQQI